MHLSSFKAVRRWLLSIPVLILGSSLVSAFVLWGIFSIAQNRLDNGGNKKGIESQNARMAGRLVARLGSEEAGSFFARSPRGNESGQKWPMQVLIDHTGKVFGNPDLEPIVFERLPNESMEPESQIKNSAGLPDTTVTKLPGHEDVYLVATRKPQAKIIREQYIGTTGIVILCATFLFSLLSLLVLVQSLRGHAHRASKVMEKLRSGNLKARFKVGRLDDLGKLMGQFNLMADEIERLVHNIRVMEKSRSQWLQELAHDLRTPMASLEISQAALLEEWERMSATQRVDLLTSGGKEVRYVRDLIDDMLFLALLEDPEYFKRRERMDAALALKGEIEHFQTKASLIQKTLKQMGAPAEKAILEINPQLFKRLLKNCLENALKYGAHEIRVGADVTGQRLNIFIENDGPGFPAAILEQFGKKRNPGQSGATQDLRKSLGLGSTIIFQIVDAIGGTVRAENLVGQDGQITGARVTLQMILAHENQILNRKESVA